MLHQFLCNVCVKFATRVKRKFPNEEQFHKDVTQKSSQTIRVPGRKNDQEVNKLITMAASARSSGEAAVKTGPIPMSCKALVVEAPMAITFCAG